MSFLFFMKYRIQKEGGRRKKMMMMLRFPLHRSLFILRSTI